jgi:hypothetical protein
MYQNELLVDIASEFVSFVRGKYPHISAIQVEAHYLKLAALDMMFDRLQPVQKREAGVTANVLLSFIDRMKVEVSPLPQGYSRFEAAAYGVHGQIALDGGTEESARRAVAYFEKELKVNKACGNAEGLQNANRREEAIELLTKLLATSKQVLGLHHKITKNLESTRQC